MKTEKEVREIIQKFNNMIDEFMSEKLPELLKAEGIPVVNGKVTLYYWFRVQEIIRKQNFDVIGGAIQKVLRNAGFDVKMDMQSHKLELY